VIPSRFQPCVRQEDFSCCEHGIQIWHGQSFCSTHNTSFCYGSLHSRSYHCQIPHHQRMDELTRVCSRISGCVAHVRPSVGMHAPNLTWCTVCSIDSTSRRFLYSLHGGFIVYLK
jgi:hypothetical protein